MNILTYLIQHYFSQFLDTVVFYYGTKTSAKKFNTFLTVLQHFLVTHAVSMSKSITRIWYTLVSSLKFIHVYHIFAFSYFQTNL